MGDSGQNLRFEVRVNGKVVATTGIEHYGVLTQGVTWVRRDPEQVAAGHHPLGPDDEDWLAEELELHIGGLDSAAKEHLGWDSDQALQVGDEVTVRILPPGPVDAPTRRTPERDVEG